jgi:hypothetical protein
MHAKARQSLIAVFLVTACTVSAPGEIVRIGLTAEITYIDQYDQWLNENFKLGDLITGSYTYDTSAPDQNPSSAIGYYLFSEPPCGVVLNVNQFTFQTNPDDVDFRSYVVDDIYGGDSFGFISYRNVASADDILFNSIGLGFYDYSGKALSGDTLSRMPPVLADWEQPVDLTLEFGARSGPILRAKLTSAVPEPSSIFLLGLGAFLLIRRRRA